MKRKVNKSKVKGKNLVATFFIVSGILGFILYAFGSQFDGTLSDEIQKAGMLGMGLFALWGIANLVNAYVERKELENL